MIDPTPMLVVGLDDWRGTLLTPLPPADDDTEATIQLEDGRRLRVPAHLLARRDDHFYLPLRLADLETQAIASHEERVIPVVEERAHVTTRPVETGRVRLTKHVHEREEQVEVPLLRETVEVERVPVERYVDEPPQVRQEGDHWVVPVVEEVLVVEKRLLLKEEIHVRRQQTRETTQKSVRLRREHVEIERADEHGDP